PIFVEEPPPPEPEPLPAPPPVVQQQAPKPKPKKLLPAVYGVHPSKPRKAGHTFTLYISFKVRRPVSIGIEALRGGKVISKSGVKRFTGKRGRLALKKLTRKRWPTKIRWVTPKAAAPASWRNVGSLRP